MPKRMPSADIDIPRQVLESIKSADVESTIVLIGSAARNAMTWRSDIDLMIITLTPVKKLSAPQRIHLHFEARSRFLSRLSKGDEFVAWAVRFGRVLYDPTGWWNEVLRKEARWPDWRQKIGHIERRLRTASVAIIDGDQDAAEEELMMAASHCARALLLGRGEFPLSRPELAGQLTAVGQRRLATLLTQLIEGGNDLAFCKQGFAFLNHISRELRLTAAKDAYAAAGA